MSIYIDVTYILPMLLDTNNIKSQTFFYFKHLAYEYARRGAHLALGARREDRLRAVADKALRLGSPDAIVIRADVKEVEDCRRLVEETVSHFGQCMKYYLCSMF